MDDYICLECSFIGAIEQFQVDDDIPQELVELFMETHQKNICPLCSSTRIEPYEMSEMHEVS